MKKFLLIIIPIVVIAALGAGFYWYNVSYASAGNLNIYNGDVTVVHDGKNIVGKTGTAIQPHDTLKVAANSRASIILKDGSVIRLEGGTEVEVAQLDYNGKQLKTALFKLNTGRIWSKVHPLANGASFNTETPTTVAAIRGTGYNTDYLNHISTYYVYTGHVGVSQKNQSGNAEGEPSILDPGMVIQIHDDPSTIDSSQGPALIPEDKAIVIPDSQIDDWIRFNQAEDNKFDGLPAPDLQTLPTNDSSNTSNFGTNSDVNSNTTTNTTQANTNTPTPPTPKPVPPVPQPPAPKPIVLTRLSVSCKKTYSAQGQLPNAQCSATGYYSDGSSIDRSDQVSWSVTGSAGGRISQTGYYTPVTAGSATVTADLGNISGSTSFAIP